MKFTHFIDKKLPVLIYNKKDDADLIMPDGGVAAFHNNGEGIVTSLYQDRVPDDFDEEIHGGIWDVLGEGKSYSVDWKGIFEINDEMIRQAIAWLDVGGNHPTYMTVVPSDLFQESCPVCESINIRKDYDFPESMKCCNACLSEWDDEGEILLNTRLIK